MPAVKQPEERRGARGRVAWLAAAAVGSLALAVVVSLAGLSRSRSGAVCAKYDQIEVGMTEEQVVGLLGEPHPASLIRQGSTWCWEGYWDIDDHRITVEVSLIDGVREKSIKPMPRPLAYRVKVVWEAIWPF